MKTGVSGFVHRLQINLVPGGRDRWTNELDVYAVRKWLRTTLTVVEIAEKMGCGKNKLVSFIHRRNLLDIKERAKMHCFMRNADPLAWWKKRDADLQLTAPPK